MDELAVACGLDPIELRVRNDPPVDPESGRPWSSRRLVECLREGARVFGWDPADRTPGTRRDGRWLVGTGVAAASYPHLLNPGTEVAVRHDGDGRYTVRTGAADIGTGAWTALTLIAADALGCGPEDIHLEIGDSALPNATVAGGSSGTSSWGTAIVAAAHAFRKRHGDRPDPAPRPRRRPRRTPPSSTTESSRSARISPRCGWTSTPARSGCRGCTACSRWGGWSTPAPHVRS